MFCIYKSTDSPSFLGFGEGQARPWQGFSTQGTVPQKLYFFSFLALLKVRPGQAGGLFYERHGASTASFFFCEVDSVTNGKASERVLFTGCVLVAFAIREHLEKALWILFQTIQSKSR